MHQQLNHHELNHFSQDPVLSCALEGVANVLAGIKDVSIVIHSPQGCAATVGAAYDQHEIDFTKRKLACTRLFEKDIILGATEKLEHMIRTANENYKSEVMFVVGTCAADIIGEDMEAVCRMMQPEVDAKLIPIQAGGFRGSSYNGMDLGLQALFPLIKKASIKVNNSINLIAPQANSNPTWWADLDWVRKILGELDIYVQTVFTHETSLREIEEAGMAGANLLLSLEGGYQFAKKMEEEHEIPLIMSDLPQPIGLKNTGRWLRALGEYFGKVEEVEKIIVKEEKRVVNILRKRALMMIPRYRNCRIALSSDATIGISIIRMLFEELEMIPEVVLLKNCTSNAKEILESELCDMGLQPTLVLNADGYEIKKALELGSFDMLIGSAWEKYIGEEVGIKILVDVFEPTNRELYINESYYGYDGMLHLLQAFANDWERALRSKEIKWKEAT